MLVLSRRQGEQIVVPSCGLTVTVLGVEGRKVRLGISAPRGIGVYRTEVMDRMMTSECRTKAALLSLEDHDVDSRSDCRP